MSFGVKRLTCIFWQKKWGEMSFGVKRRREKCHGEKCLVGRNVLHPMIEGTFGQLHYLIAQIFWLWLEKLETLVFEFWIYFNGNRVPCLLFQMLLNFCNLNPSFLKLSVSTDTVCQKKTKFFLIKLLKCLFLKIRTKLLFFSVYQSLKWYTFLFKISVILNLNTLYSVMYAPFWVKFNLCFNYSNFIIKFRRKVAIFSISIKGKRENYHTFSLLRKLTSSSIFFRDRVELHYLNISSWINNGFSIQSLCLA